jgi:hypothetical protein
MTDYEKGDCSQPQLATPSWPPQGRTTFYWFYNGKHLYPTRRCENSGPCTNHANPQGVLGVFSYY